MITVLFDRAATEYGQDYHPERPERLINTEAYLLDKHPDWVWKKPRLATEEEVLRAHHPKLLERLRKPVDIDPDTPYHPGIEDHARRAAGAAIGSVDLALSGRKGFSLMRPPGHHATPTQAMGFCYLNSIAIAALYALAAGCERVAIWDFDAHHGNGTEAIVSGTIGSGLRRFTNIPAIRVRAAYHAPIASIGQFRHEPMPKSMPRPSTGLLIAYANSARTSYWSRPASMPSLEIRSRR